MKISDIKGGNIFSNLPLRVPELKAMLSIKSEPSDRVDVDKHRIRLMDDNPHISGTNSSDKLAYKSLSKEMFLTVAYVKSESTSNTFDYNTSNAKENEDNHGQQLIDINDFKTEKTEACIDNTSGDVTDDEPTTMHVEDKSQHYDIKGNEIDYVTAISQHHGVGKRDEIDMAIMGDIWPSNATQSRAETHKCIKKRKHSAKMRFKCDLCAYSTGIYLDLKKHKRVHSREKPFKCNLCEYSATQYEHLKIHQLIHTGEKPYKCDECDYSARTSWHLKRHQLVHSRVKLLKCS